MIQDTELLNHVHENADMGIAGIKQIMEIADDTKFISTLEDELKEYEKTYHITEEMLKKKGMIPKDARMMSKAMSYLSANIKTLTDHSPAKLSEIMIQGSTMGITNLTKQINNYEGNDKEVLEIAKKQVRTEQNNVEEMKKYL